MTHRSWSASFPAPICNITPSFNHSAFTFLSPVHHRKVRALRTLPLSILPHFPLVLELISKCSSTISHESTFLLIQLQMYKSQKNPKTTQTSNISLLKKFSYAIIIDQIITSSVYVQTTQRRQKQLLTAYLHCPLQNSPKHIVWQEMVLASTVESIL